MEHLDWSTFKKRISVNTSEEKLFDFWTTQSTIEKWFLSQAQFYRPDKSKRESNSKIEVGDTYEWMWHGSDNVAEGEVLEINGRNYLEFTFLGCVVSVNIKEEDGENVVELTQKEIPLDERSRMSYFVGCSRGWTFYLANLKSILEGGIDLRNRNKNLADVINT